MTNLKRVETRAPRIETARHDRPGDWLGRATGISDYYAPTAATQTAARIDWAHAHGTKVLASAPPRIADQEGYWQSLADWGADLVLTDHASDYHAWACAAPGA